MSESLRRSGRARTANKKYVNNDWDRDTLRLLRESSTSSGSTGVEEGHVTPVPSDDEFDEEPVNEELSDQDVSDDVSMASSHIATPQYSDAENDARSDKASVASVASVANRKTMKRIGFKKAGNLHSRGLVAFDRKVGRTTLYYDTWGPLPEDLDELLKVRDRWHLRARDATMPSRVSLDLALGHEWLLSVEALNGSISQVRSVTRQQLKPCSVQDLVSSGHFPAGHSHQLVLGPWQNWTEYGLEHLQAFNYGVAWEKAHNGSPQSELNMTNSPFQEKPSNSSYHEGWLLNTGEKIQTLAWINSTDATCEYLAVACRATSSQRARVPKNETNKSQAFSRSSGYPSCIQIWRIFSQQVAQSARKMLSFQNAPQLYMVLGTDYGDIKQVAWIAQQPSSEDESRVESVGSLVFLTTDGCIRSIELVLGASEEPSPLTFNIYSPSLGISSPEDCVFTTFALMNKSDIIVGGSDGAIRLYNLDQCAKSDNTKPYLSLQLHNTYIMKIVPAGTKEHPYYIASTSAAGDIRLTDLRAPHQDFVTITRTRIPTSNLVYLPSTQSFITTIDHAGRTDIQSTRTTIAAHQFRHLYSQILLSKLPNNTGTASALAASRLHPYILVGNTEGTVVCQNILKRLLPRSGGWMQKLCEYEWIPQLGSLKDSSPSNGAEHSESQGLYHGKDARPGISRLQEGFMIEKQDLSTNASTPKPKSKGNSKAKGKEQRGKKRKATTDSDGGDQDEEAQTYAEEKDQRNEGEREDQEAEKKDIRTDQAEAGNDMVAEFIFDEEQAVTVIAWNESPRCASWIGIGWGSGILRIQDLSHDVK